MAKKVGDLIKALFTKAGIDLTKDEIKKVVELTDELPDDIADSVDKALIAVGSAHENTDVIKKVRTVALNAVDKKMDDAIAELGLEMDDDFKGNKNTFDKILLLSKAAKIAGEKKAAPGTSAKDKIEWADKERELQRLLKEEKDGRINDKKDFDTVRANDGISFELKQLLGGKNYVFPKEMDASIKINTAMGAVQAELAKKGFSINRNEQGQLCILTKDGTPAYSDTHVALEPNTFIDGVLAQNKLLTVTKEPATPGAGGNEIIADASKGNLAVATEIAQELQALDKMS